MSRIERVGAMNPIVGRRVRITQNDRLVYVGIVIDSFWAPEFYRLVIEVETRYDGFPDVHDEAKSILVVPIGNGAHAFQAFVMPQPREAESATFERKGLT